MVSTYGTSSVSDVEYVQEVIDIYLNLCPD